MVLLLRSSLRYLELQDSNPGREYGIYQHLFYFCSFLLQHVGYAVFIATSNGPVLRTAGNLR